MVQYVSQVLCGHLGAGSASTHKQLTKCCMSTISNVNFIIQLILIVKRSIPLLHSNSTVVLHAIELFTHLLSMPT